MPSAYQKSRRERLREATLSEICASARALLVAEGSAAVTMNAVARAMGMTGPALYRYYASQAELMEGLKADLFRELIETMRAAGDQPDFDTPAERLLSICRALRGWAVAHPAEFRILFASPVPAPSMPHCDPSSSHSGYAFGQVFLEQVVVIWEAQRFPIPSLDDMDPAIAEQLQVYSERIGGRLPPEAAYVFLTCWMRLYGLLCMEVLNQIGFAFSNVEPIFEGCLKELCEMLDIAYSPPGR
ncbi:TetR/AcrR family transcriptional regulator [Nitratireductor sp. GCM10026969]|uniref:TetR/AcrR family transcriptional regulator n=1 Tax=Nitratireductor sp. GCM10026969 TaxID=3252645 RepID=UPI003617A970